MFFRNFMPDVDKVSSKLVSREGRTAYACQCCWASVELGQRTPTEWFAVR